MPIGHIGTQKNYFYTFFKHLDHCKLKKNQLHVVFSKNKCCKRVVKSYIQKYIVVIKRLLCSFDATLIL